MRLTRAEAVLMAQAARQGAHAALTVLLLIKRRRRQAIPRLLIPRERLSLESYNDIDALADFRSDGCFEYIY